MDICRNISVSGGLQYQQPPECQLGSLDDLFSGHPLEEEGDVNMEWLSTFMEECLSSTGNSLLPPPPTPKPTQSPPPSSLLHLDKLVIPVKGTRSKRKRSQSHPTTFITKTTRPSWWAPPPPHNPLLTTSDPPLLHQAYWLADSELIFPPKQHQNGHKQEQVVSRQKRRKKKKNDDDNGGGGGNLMMEKEEEEEGSNNSSNNGGGGGGGGGGMRRCSHCLSQRTPQWRAGPLGPKTLCNACGVRYKSGRLLPEYRPAKSPSFVSYMHSNSHKKVLEMRTLSLFTPDSSSSSPSS